MKFTITLDEKQLGVVRDALDMYSRMGMGQLDVSVEEFLRLQFYNLYYEKPVDWDNPDLEKGKLVEAHINDVKALVFGHPPSGSWGIYNREVPQVCREAYDIKQVLEYERQAERQRRKPVAALDYVLTQRSYLPSNPEWPPVECAAVPEEVPDEVEG